VHGRAGQLAEGSFVEGCRVQDRLRASLGLWSHDVNGGGCKLRAGLRYMSASHDHHSSMRWHVALLLAY
jgi:hypothetical protein